MYQVMMMMIINRREINFLILKNYYSIEVYLKFKKYFLNIFGGF